MSLSNNKFNVFLTFSVGIKPIGQNIRQKIWKTLNLQGKNR